MKKILSNISQFLTSRPRFDWVFVGVLLAVYVGLALYNITANSIWFDEAFSSYIIQYNVIDIARYTATDVHPPLFYWLLKGWTMLFGTTELGLRTMSIFFGVIAAVFAYLWTRRSFGRRAALVALAILVLSPLFIRYSQEARMYTLSAAIVFAATYVLSLAQASKGRKLWIIYGVLISLGMWTHYFTALAWIAHWVWRFVMLRKTGARGKALFKKFFDKNWLWAYGLAVALYLPWLPAMVIQLIVVQASGFWIGAVGIDTVGGYFGTLVYFLQSYQITGWFAAILLAAGLLVTILSLKTYKALKANERSSFILLLSMAAVPPILLFIASLPPLTPSFVERYLIPAAVASALFSGVVLSIGLRGTRLWKKLLVAVVVVAMLISGLSTMYFYGNYNKNSRIDIETEQLMKQAIERSEPGQPIITNSPWLFYEAIVYETDDHPVYFLDESTDYYYGSLDMLQYSDAHKIKDLDAFMKENPKIWYIGYSETPLESPRDSWKAIDETSVTSNIDGNTVYQATEYQAN